MPSEPEQDQPGATPPDGPIIDIGPLPRRDEPPLSGAERRERAGIGASIRARRVPWLFVALAACLVAAIGAHLRADSGSDRAAARPSAPEATLAASPAPVSTQPVYWEAPRPILGVTEAWELFGYGDGVVVRVQFGDGGVTRTPIPPLDSTGPVSFVAGRGWAIVRPLDRVAGYLVRERRPAAPLAGALATGGLAIAGPDPGDVWVPSDRDYGDKARLDLVTIEGYRVGPHLTLPADLARAAQSDGDGYLVAQDGKGVYAIRPGHVDRVTTGQLLAVGPTRWLTRECDAGCAMSVYDRESGAARRLGVDAPPLPDVTPLGVISPNGAHAAIMGVGASGGAAVHLVDLDTGGYRTLTIPMTARTGSRSRSGGGMVFSPDSRWLFVVGDSGVLYAVDVATGAGQTLDVVLPPLRRLAILP